MKRDGLQSTAVAPRVFTLDGGQGLRVQVMDLGATWLSCQVAVAGENPREVLLGHAQPLQHLSEPGYLGATIGRYANRIALARFTLDGQAFTLAPNQGPHQLHGGPDGFNRRRWRVTHVQPQALHLDLQSPDGDQGFPGQLDVQVRYCLGAPGVLRIEFEATCSAPCPVSLTSHAYFNLDASHSVAPTVLGQQLQVAAQQFVPTDASLIPVGHLAAVAGTAFDMRAPRPIGELLHQHEQQRLAGGYDHCYLLDPACQEGRAPAAGLWSSDGRLMMRLHTSYPGLQVYSGNHLSQCTGRDGQPFEAFAGMALEPQFLPDSPNRPDWPQPTCVLRPGQRMQQFIEYRFADARHFSSDSA